MKKKKSSSAEIQSLSLDGLVGGQSIYWVLLTLFLVLLCVQRFLISDAEIGGFFDEQVNILSPLNFFRMGIYGPRASALVGYEVSTSSGFMVTWAAGLGWIFGKSIFWARAFFFCFHFSLYLAVSHLFLERMQIFASKRSSVRFETLALAVALYLLTSSIVPYSQGVTVSILGEWVAALFLALGYLYLNSRPRLAAIFLGISIWHCKFIYIPFALIGLAYMTLLSKRPVGMAIKLFGCFMAPLLAWMVIIVLTVGFHGWWTYLSRNFLDALSIFTFLSGQKPVGAKLDPIPVHGLFNRLSSPQLEWVTYQLGQKIKIVALLVGPTVLLWVAAWKNFSQGSQQRKPHSPMVAFQLAIAGMMLVFSYWWFWTHTGMWIRHLLPALFMGWGTVLWFVMGRVQLIGSPRRRLVVLVFVAAIAGREALRIPTLWKSLRDPAYPSRYSVRSSDPNPLKISNEEFMARFAN